MRIAIMQPTYLPWMGYFALIDQVDTFVILDDVEYNHRSWQQRNRVKTNNGITWLTVPVITSGKSGQLIKSAEINQNEKWEKSHFKTIKFNYASADYFDDIISPLKSVYNEDWEMLLELNETLISLLSEKLGLHANFVRSSDLNADGSKAYRLVNICNEVGANEYLSPLGSKGYIEADNPFPKAGIDLLYQNFEHPTYSQLHGEFVSHMSAVDLLFNEGPRSLEVIRAGEEVPYTSEEAREIE